ncbi:MAG: 4Fe-4S dicluster domain-containing protein [Anaerolineales bacterium]|nr:MAG: 4Fe-4S dicluster domain-containing protein [Anaerolineales bacterium]
MARWGMVIDLDKCFACQSCTLACRMENNTPVAGPDQASRGRAILWNEVLPFVEGEYPEVTMALIPRPCQHCDNPPCTKVCPVKATYKDEEGIVCIDYGRCIGCRFCTVACPYQVRYFNWYRPEWPEALKEHLNPDPEVAPRPKGVVEKCTFCIQRLRKAREGAEAEGRPFTATDYTPACVQTCTGRARYFGDLDDPNSLVSQLAASPRAFRLLEEMGTQPKVYYLKQG